MIVRHRCDVGFRSTVHTNGFRDRNGKQTLAGIDSSDCEFTLSFPIVFACKLKGVALVSNSSKQFQTVPNSSKQFQNSSATLSFFKSKGPFTKSRPHRISFCLLKFVYAFCFFSSKSSQLSLLLVWRYHHPPSSDKSLTRTIDCELQFVAIVNRRPAHGSMSSE